MFDALTGLVYLLLAFEILKVNAVFCSRSFFTKAAFHNQKLHFADYSKTHLGSFQTGYHNVLDC